MLFPQFVLCSVKKKKKKENSFFWFDSFKLLPSLFKVQHKCYLISKKPLAWMMHKNREKLQSLSMSSMRRDTLDDLHWTQNLNASRCSVAIQIVLHSNKLGFSEARQRVLCLSPISLTRPVNISTSLRLSC